MSDPGILHTLRHWLSGKREVVRAENGDIPTKPFFADPNAETEQQRAHRLRQEAYDAAWMENYRKEQESGTAKPADEKPAADVGDWCG